MNRIIWAGALLFTIFCQGCIPGDEPTATLKDPSFRPFQTTMVGGEPLKWYLAERTRALVSTRTILFLKGPITTGAYVMLTGDGYLLTAGHCLDGGPYYALPPWAYPGQPPLRIVWKPSRPGDPDLAVLKWDVNHGDPTVGGAGPLPHFRWAGIPRSYIDKAVVADGWMSGASAGTLDMIIGSDPGPLHYWLLVHTAPLVHGDSGGPLATTDGGLLGINYRGGWFPPTQTYLFVAVRPDLQWLQSIIAADQAAHHLPTPDDERPAATQR